MITSNFRQLSLLLRQESLRSITGFDTGDPVVSHFFPAKLELRGRKYGVLRLFL